MTATTYDVNPVARTAPLPEHAEIVVVGAGFAGLGAAVALRDAGHDVLVLERGEDVGGTWRVNTYPGCACDIPSLVYSYSFAPKPDWQSTFSPQPQIFDYLRGVARDFDLLQLIRFGVEVRDATWDTEAMEWRLQTSAGPMSCEKLIAATGPLSEPSIPSIPGADTFRGDSWHSAEWRHDVDLTGKRVAVVGTGASAIQFVPHVQQTAAHLTLFQRTPTWIMPRRDRRFTGWERTLHRLVPGLQRVRRAATYAALESRIVGFTRWPGLLRLGEKIALRHLHKQVPDPQLRAKLTPSFRLGCKRVLMSNTFYPALAADNADVVTDRIVEMTATGIVTQAPDGRRTEHEVDVVIWGTGFRVTDPPVAEAVTGATGRTLAEEWRAGGMQALRGLTVSGFPNFFIMIGPNTGLGHNSMVIMMEAQMRYLVDLLRQAGESTVVEPRLEAQTAWNDEMQRRLATTVWNTGGCSSWYLDAHGRNTTLWPGSTVRFIRELRHADLGEYDVTRRPARTREPVAA